MVGNLMGVPVAFIRTWAAVNAGAWSGSLYIASVGLAASRGPVRSRAVTGILALSQVALALDVPTLL